MSTYPKILGYLGVLPFIIFLMGAVFFKSAPMMGNLFIAFQIFYASIILSFVSGVHWPLALKNDDNIRLSYCMIPTIISLFLMGFVFIGVFIYPLLAMVIMFTGVYMLDKKYADQSGWGKDYLTFRRNVTLIVCAILLISFGISV